VRQQSGLFPSYQRALQGAQLQAGDSDISFPDVIINSLEPAYAHSPHEQVAPGGTFGDVSRASFIQSLSLTRTAAAGLQDTDIFVLSQGVWDLSLDWELVLPVAVTSCFCFISFQKDDFSIGFQLANLWNARATGAIIKSNFSQHHKLLVPLGTVMKFTVEVDNTAGATNMFVSGFFNCRRLS
jgi:hypothetical protein